MTQRLFIDFEAYSETDIEKEGGMAYTMHDSTHPWCMSLAFQEGDVALWIPGKEIHESVLDHVADGGLVYAHNATFDYRMWNYTCVRDFGWPEMKPDQLVDTMALVNTYALPGSLDKSGQAMKLQQPKTAGKALINRCCRPQPVKNGHDIRGYRKPGPWNTKDKPYFDQLYEYCINDVAAMRELVFKLPRPELIPQEQAVWLMTFWMNQRGLPVDPTEIACIKNRIEKFMEEQSKVLSDITDEIITSPFQYARIKDYCTLYGYPIKNCQKDYLEKLTAKDVDGNLVHPDMPEEVRQVLELQQLLGMTSTAKYRAFNNLMIPAQDGTTGYRVHDNLVYHGASTGRWTGRGVQMHNFPRAQSEQPEEDIQKFMNNDPIENPVDLGKQLVRSMIKAPEGHQFIVADYSAIENRVLAWILEDEDTLRAFRDGYDQYITMASARYHVPYDEILKGYKEGISKYVKMRRTGKTIILGCQYGMGWETYKKTCEGYDIYLTDDEAKADVNAYREFYTLVVAGWKGLTRAAIKAVTTGQKTQYGKIKFGVGKIKGIPWLAMLLPSGKSLYYQQPRVEARPIPKYEQMGPVSTIMYMGQNPYAGGKWMRLPLIPSGITNNAVQGTSRDIMAYGMLNVEREMKEVSLIGTVHDEAIGMIQEEAIYDGTLDIFINQLCDVSWATDCPITANGYIGKRFRKD